MDHGICRFCGADSAGITFNTWVKPTFTDWDKLLPGQIACASCLFWFDEASAELAAATGKDKPQRMRNYSHFIVNGRWIPLSKGSKAQMMALLCDTPFPELAAIADSGQKHIVFRATRNAQGGAVGWVQFEEQRLWVDPPVFRTLVEQVEALYVTFSKTEIETGHYLPQRILKFGMEAWYAQEQQIKVWRGKPLFALALFLAQRSDDDNRGTSAAGSDAPVADMAGDGDGLQEQIPTHDLDAIRGRGAQRGLHEQSGQIRQLSLFET